MKKVPRRRLVDLNALRLTCLSTFALFYKVERQGLLLSVFNAGFKIQLIARFCFQDKAFKMIGLLIEKHVAVFGFINQQTNGLLLIPALPGDAKRAIRFDGPNALILLRLVVLLV